MHFYFSVIPDDIHICGACRKQFSDVDEFVQHKKHGCPVLLSLQSGTQPVVSQPEVSSDCLPAGNQVTQADINRFTIPLPSIQVHDTYGSHQSLGTRQDPGAENQYQVQQVSSTEEVGAYDHVTGTSLQTNQSGEYVSAPTHLPFFKKNIILACWFDTWYAASGVQVLPSCSNNDPGLTLTYFMARSNLFPYAFVWEKR